EGRADLHRRHRDEDDGARGRDRRRRRPQLPRRPRVQQRGDGAPRARRRPRRPDGRGRRPAAARRVLARRRPVARARPGTRARHAVPRPAAAHHEGERRRARAPRGDRRDPHLAGDRGADRAGDVARARRRRAADHGLRDGGRVPREGRRVRRRRLHLPGPLPARRRRRGDDRGVRHGRGMSLTPYALDEALALRAADPSATVVAGGTDVMVGVNLGRLHPTSLLDLSRVSALAEWRRDADRLSVGAGVTFARLARELPEAEALAAAAATVGSAQVRNRATLGGNLVTASPAGDGLAALAAYDAEIVLASARGTRSLPWRAFLTGPKRTALAPDELLIAAEWRPARGRGVFLQLDEDAHTARLALGSVGPTVLRAPAAEALAATLDWDAPDDRALEELGRLAALAARPIDDLRGSAAYRRRAVEVLTRRAFAAAFAGRALEAAA